MKKITYLFGAGASANAIPVVADIPSSFNRIIENKLNGFSLSEGLSETFDKFIKDIEWLKKECASCKSVDVYARRLHLKKQKDELERLKNALSVWFTLIQLMNKPDNRYDSFFANILKDSNDGFPNNMTILSWNYDCQFELNYMKYLLSWNEESILKASKDLKILTKNCFGTYDIDCDLDEFSIVKLNGSAAIGNRAKQVFYYTPYFKQDDDTKVIDEIIYNYQQLSPPVPESYSGNQNLLSFAWEDDQGSFMPCISKVVDKTEILVVVGYSFPYLNRSIDIEIINSMPLLKIVYIQDPNADGVIEELQDIISAEKNIQIIPRYKVSDFYLPPEFIK